MNIFKKMYNQAKEKIEPKLSPIEEMIKKIFLHNIINKDITLYKEGGTYVLYHETFMLELNFDIKGNFYATFFTDKSRIEARFDEFTSNKLREAFNKEMRTRISTHNQKFEAAILNTLNEFIGEKTVEETV